MDLHNAAQVAPSVDFIATRLHNSMKLENDIWDAIFEVILPAYEASTEDSVVISRVWPGQTISASQYSNPWSPTNPGGLQAVTENLSRLVDIIPHLSSTYSPSGRKVEEEYGRVVNFARAIQSAAGNRSKAQVESSHLENALTHHAPVTDTMLRFAAEVSDSIEMKAKAPDGNTNNYVALTPDAHIRKQQSVRYANQLAQLSALRTIQQRSAPAKALELQAEVTLLEDNTAKLQNDLTLLKRASAKNAPSPGPSGTVRPNAVFDVDAPSSVDHALYEARKKFEISEMASLLNPGLSYHPAYLTPDNWAEEGSAADWPFIKIPIENGGRIISLSLSFSRVDIVRPWFLMSLFDLPDWELSNTSSGPGSLSNGHVEKNDGSFPLLPMSLVVARNIWAVDAAGTTVFRASGLQILAWISKVMPYGPPAQPHTVPGSIMVSNRGAFICRYAVTWRQDGDTFKAKSGNLPALAAKVIPIPAHAEDISVTVEVMTFPPPFETWKTVATPRFNSPVRQCYELSGETFNVRFVEVACGG